MNEQKLDEVLDQLLEQHKNGIAAEIDRMRESGMINLDDYKGRESHLAGVLLTAAAGRKSNMFAPHAFMKTSWKDIFNLNCITG